MPELTIVDSKTTLKALISEISVLGECKVSIANSARKTKTKIIIIKGRRDSLSLLGRPTLKDLGMVIIDKT